MTKYCAIFILVIFLGGCSLFFPPQLYDAYKDTTGGENETNLTNTTIMYVSVDTGNDENDGLSPSAPKKTIQLAIDETPLDIPAEIRIEVGYYTPAEGLIADTNLAAITINRDNIHLSGRWTNGFSMQITNIESTECTYLEVDSQTDLKSNTIILIKSTSTEPLTNIIIDSFVISGGHAYLYGGGISLSNVANSSIMNCEIFSNYAPISGGGIALLNSSNISIESNSIYENTSGSYGGGIGLTYSHSVTLFHNDIEENNANDYGGGLAIYSSHLTYIDYNTFISNSCNVLDGGAILLFTHNDGATDYSLVSSENTITNNEFSYNISTGDGSAIYVNSVTNTKIYDNNFYSNASTSTIFLMNSTGVFSFSPIGAGTEIVNNYFTVEDANSSYICGFNWVSYHLIAGNNFNTGIGSIPYKADSLYITNVLGINTNGNDAVCIVDTNNTNTEF